MRRLLLTVALLLGATTSVRADTTFSNACVGSGTTTTVTAASCAVSGSDRNMLVWIMVDTIPAAEPTTIAVAFNTSESATRVCHAGFLIDGNAKRYVALWQLTDATATTADIVVTNLPGGGINQTVVVHNYTGAEPINASSCVDAGTAGLSASNNITCAAGGIAADGINVDGGSTNGVITAGGSQTQPANGAGPGTGMASRTSYQVGAGTTTHSWDWSAGSSQSWSQALACVPPAAGGAATPCTRSLMGVGCAPIPPVTHDEDWYEQAA